MAIRSTWTARAYGRPVRNGVPGLPGTYHGYGRTPEEAVADLRDLAKRQSLTLGRPRLTPPRAEA